MSEGPFPYTYSVTELSHALQNVIQAHFDLVYLRGEVSQPKQFASGHLYFRLKDEQSVLEAICWHNTLERLEYFPEDGMEVICHGRISTYPGRSQYQIVVEQITVTGEGALLQTLEKRKKSLSQEGLFDQERKRPIPFLPTSIGVITSPQGAAYQDILHRLSERCPRRVILWPVLVEGKLAPDQITQAIQGFPSIKNPPDVLILARGGGSFESLMPFNEERVVRAVARCPIPIISAIGHETDTTLVDYASDLRAPTPTAAAEKVVPVRSLVMNKLFDEQSRLSQACHSRLSYRQETLRSLSHTLGSHHPRYRLDTLRQLLDDRGERLDSILRYQCRYRHNALQTIRLPDPREAVEKYRQTLENRHLSLKQNVRRNFIQADHRLTLSSHLLNSLGYQQVLARGYVIVRDRNNTPLPRALQTYHQQRVTLVFYDKILGATIDHQIKTRSFGAEETPIQQTLL